MTHEAVWITGVGTANPLGCTFAESAAGLLAGKSGIARVTDFKLPDHLSQIAGRVPALPSLPGWDELAPVLLTPVDRLLHYCAIDALRSAGLWEQRGELRLGVVLGLGAEFMHSWEASCQDGGSRVCEPTRDSDSCLDRLQHNLQLTGPGATVAAACASGNFALAQARRWVQMGWVDVCLAGAGDMWVTPLAMSSFSNMRALSRRNSDPAAVSRPFDRQRDGFVMGEGGVFFVLESATAARRRRAKVFAEFAGFGASSNAYHMVMPCPDPDTAVTAMRAALHDAQLDPTSVDYINAHATGTQAGDTAESKVLMEVFGPTIHRIPVSSTKSMTGHLLSGAGALNALACLAALENQAVPPTINLYDPDPECDLCHVPLHAREQKVQTAVSNSLGFGGSNTCVVLRKVA